MKRSEYCGKCGSLKTTLKNGASRCVPCHQRHAREYYRTSEYRRARQRQHYVFRRYGIHMEQLERLLDEQNGCCAICKQYWRSCVPAKHTPYEAIFLHHLCIDHDHLTQRVRGLLCNSCNAAIGFFEEDETRLANAVLYLRRHALLAQKRQLVALSNRLQRGFQTSCDTVTGFGSAL
jgi:hypothetical protein